MAVPLDSLADYLMGRRFCGVLIHCLSVVAQGAVPLSSGESGPFCHCGVLVVFAYVG